jgi:N-acetylglutamate synthase-like GNAT family acetyltransferase
VDEGRTRHARGRGPCYRSTMITQEPRPAEERDVQDIDALLCSAQEPICLSEAFCAIENRPRRLERLQEKLAHDLLWVIRDRDGLAGLMILEQDSSGQVAGIEYIVVAERMRKQHEIGPRLVLKAQALAGTLTAEERNGNSRKLLEKCGFRGKPWLPYLTWSRADWVPV